LTDKNTHSKIPLVEKPIQSQETPPATSHHPRLRAFNALVRKV
jgi:hypothetical protein